MNTTKPIRFATLIRVSTEAQAKKGESLKTQAAQLADYVRNLNGKIVASFGGQEHATEKFTNERKELDRLLEDSAKDKFDAVIVCDADRWSRDNARSKAGLGILKENGIKFYVGSMECDLYNPTASMFLGMSAEIAEFAAKLSRKKSIDNRVARAEKGVPSSGKLPFGRNYNTATGEWTLDLPKAAIIKDCATRYIRGETAESLAIEYNLPKSVLIKAMSQRAGDKWTIHFKVKEFQVDREFTFDVPRLLDDRTIKAVQKRSASNRTYYHTEFKRQYLLGRMIFCSRCGYVLNAQTVTNKYNKQHSYYRHPAKQKLCTCKRPDGANHVPTKKIDKLVLNYLYDTFGNTASLEKAIAAATPNKAVYDRDKKAVARLNGELKVLRKGLNNLLDAVFDGLYTNEDIKERKAKIDKELAKVLETRNTLASRLEDIPTDKERRTMIGILRRQIVKKPLSEMTYAERKALCRYVFDGKDVNGKRYGVYINWSDKKTFTFDIYGKALELSGCYAMTDERQEAVFEQDLEYSSLQLVKAITLNFSLTGAA